MSESSSSDESDEETQMARAIRLSEEMAEQAAKEREHFAAVEEDDVALAIRRSLEEDALAQAMQASRGDIESGEYREESVTAEGVVPPGRCAEQNISWHEDAFDIVADQVASGSSIGSNVGCTSLNASEDPEDKDLEEAIRASLASMENVGISSPDSAQESEEEQLKRAIEQSLADQGVGEAAEPEPASAEPQSSDIKLKVFLNGEARRLRFTAPLDASETETFNAICRTIHEGFGLALDSPLDFKYKDDEGDMCTLAKQTVSDFLDVPQGSTLKLFAERLSVDRMLSSSSQLEEEDRSSCNDVDRGSPTAQEFSISTPPSTPRQISQMPEADEPEDDDSSWQVLDMNDA